MATRDVGPLRIFARRSPRRLVGILSLTPGKRPRGLHLGSTLHRGGGVSIIGIPRRGGTSIVWGEKLRQHIDDHACDCTRRAFGPVSIHFGEDF